MTLNGLKNTRENAMSSMGEQHSSKSAAIASEVVEKCKATAERSALALEQSYSTAVENMREYNLKVIDMARANVEAVFEIARQLSAAKTPPDMIELWTSHTRKQFERLSEQTKEFTVLGQKMVGESTEPIRRSVNQAFGKAA
jgi:phasin